MGSFAERVVAAAAIATVFGTLVTLGDSTSAAAKKPATTSQSPTASATKSTVAPNEVVAAVRRAALPLAASVSVELGTPTCPTGIRDTSLIAAQCLVAFGNVSVPFLVRRARSGTLEASSLVAVHRRTDIERQAAAASGGTARCGSEPVVVVPVGSTVRCTAGKTSILLTVLPGGSVVVDAAVP